MITLRELIKDVPPDSKIGQMIAKSEAPRKGKRRILVNAKPPKGKPFPEKVSSHELEVIGTLQEGFGICRPCSSLYYRPGTKVLAHGHPATVKWGLDSGESTLLVVLFDKPHEIVRKPHMTSRWEIVVAEMCVKV